MLQGVFCAPQLPANGSLLAMTSDGRTRAYERDLDNMNSFTANRVLF